MGESLSESRFYMWRTLFAMAHADHVITDEERAFMQKVLREVPFSDRQSFILENDISRPRNTLEMFAGVTERKDREEFFDFARELVWCDGEYDEEEKEMMLKLQRIHVQDTNVDELVGNVDLQLEEETLPPRAPQSKKKNRDFKSIISSFSRAFRG